MVGAVAVAAPYVFDSGYHRELLVLIVVWGLAALSVDMVLGMMGQFPFGHGALWGIGAYTSAVLSVTYGVPVWVAMVAAIGLSGGIGLTLGYLTLRRLREMEFALANFAFASIAFLVVAEWREVSGGMTGLYGIPDLRIVGTVVENELEYYFVGLAVLAGAVYFVDRLTHSRTGKAVRSIRENEDLARSVGVPVLKYYVIIFTTSAALVGLSGAIYAHQSGFVNPFLLHSRFILFFVIMVLIGGSGTLWGPILGTVVFVWASEMMRFDESLRFMFFGAFLLITVLFMRSGAVPTILGLWNRRGAGARRVRVGLNRRQ